MLRLAELALFFVPFAAFAVWRLMAMEHGPPVRVVVAAACLLIALVGTLVWLSQEAALPPGASYAPAEFRDGQLIPGRAAPR